MKRKPETASRFLLVPAVVTLLSSWFTAGGIRAATLWTGPDTAFTDVAGSDPTQPQNQDRLTANVWITRGSSRGIYNAKVEASYTNNFSPAGTEWASGSLTDYATLSYTDWEDWVPGHRPIDLAGVSAVVHLLSDDVYLTVTFTSWGGSGGGFSWVRSTAATPPPPSAPRLANPAVLPNGSFHFSFTNTPDLNFTVLVSTNLVLSGTNWAVAGTVTNSPAGSGVYQYTDAGATGSAVRRFYQVRYP